jgi:WD40 repeat protein
MNFSSIPSWTIRLKDTPIHNVTLSEFNSQAIISRFDSHISIVNTNTGKIIRSIPFFEKDVFVSCSKFHPKHSNIIYPCGSHGQVGAYFIDKDKWKMKTHKTSNRIVTCDFNKDGSIFATAGQMPKISFYNLET